jgi:hypothetical protein
MDQLEDVLSTSTSQVTASTSTSHDDALNDTSIAMILSWLQEDDFFS